MKKKRLFFSGLFFLGLSFALKAQEEVPIAEDIRKQTFAFVERDSTLRLDFYQSEGEDEVRPLLIFVFGGGFYTGKRNAPYYNHYFNTLVKNGLKVAAIDYRLGLKGQYDEVGVFNTQPLENAIQLAVADLYAATAYLLERSGALGIDPERIILSGSSAGAITSLHGDWHKRNQDAVAAALPTGFQYAGVIAFAGAIFSTTGKPRYDIPPAPTMLFHGTEDSTVPYNKVKLFNKGFFGSNFLAKRFGKQGYPYYFLRVKGADHSIASTPMYNHSEKILRFIEKAILEDRSYQFEATLNPLVD